MKPGRTAHLNTGDTVDISIADIVLLIAALAITFILYKFNSSMRLMNNRMNIISHTQTNMIRELQSRLSSNIDNSQAAKEAELRRRLDRDFR
ncbi:MAG: hypothetical protein ACI9OJ_002364 [Myxococcota bacterium]